MSEHPNDTRGWLLVHDQVRATLAAAAVHVGALRADDAPGGRVLRDWWLSFSRSFAHHMHTEDVRIWPSLAAGDPESVAGLRRLSDEHQAIRHRLTTVDAEIAALPARQRTDRFAAARQQVLDELAALGAQVDAHLASEEASAFRTGRDHVDAAEWGRIEQDMVKGLSLKDVSTLLPRILAEASPADRTMMLGRLPRPVRLIGEHVFVPRYRRMEARLPR